MARRTSEQAALAVMLAAVLVAPPASAGEPEQDPAVLIQQGRHLEAAEVFERLYAQNGDAALLFAKATALRRGGDCRGAIEALERFIATTPPEPDVAAAREVIDVCTEILADGEPEPPPPRLVEVQPEPTPLEDAPPPPRPWTRDVAGGALLGSGIAVSIGGAVVLGLAAARTRSREESEAGFERRGESVRTMSAVGGTLVAAGASLIIGSIVRYAVVARRR